MILGVQHEQYLWINNRKRKKIPSAPFNHLFSWFDAHIYIYCFLSNAGIFFFFFPFLLMSSCDFSLFTVNCPFVLSRFVV